jgi:hypothetical protein
VIAIDALKHTHLEADARGPGKAQDHGPGACGTAVRSNRFAALIEQGCR